MARITTRIDPLDRDIALILAQDLSPAARSKAFGGYAREVIEETDAHNDSAVGRDVTYETFVDGARSDALENAKSVIVAEWDLLTDSFEWIEEQLILHSPRGPDITATTARSMCSLRMVRKQIRHGRRPTWKRAYS
jgi:hypothetical protein